jgi:hypothetical protein
MRIIAKQDKVKRVSKKPVVHSPAEHKSEELKTDPPISEKDEIKKAEERLRESQKRRL